MKFISLTTMIMSAVHHTDLIGLFAKFLPLKEKAKRLPWIHSKFPNCLMHPPNSNLQEALEKDIPASKSGRTLMEILSLSCQNLKSYTIEKVRLSVWGQSINVTYRSQTRPLK